MNTNANLVFVPTATNGLYDTLGVDFLHDQYAGMSADEWAVEADFVQWVEATDQDDFDLAAADEIIASAGFHRVEDWDFTPGDYAQARIEPVA